MKQKKYSTEFKIEAIKMALDSVEPIAATARKLGISKTLLYSWMKTDDSQPQEIKDIMANYKALLEEVKSLKKQLVKSKQVEEILKKAAAYFAKEAQ